MTRHLFLTGQAFWIETIFALIVIACSLFIYLRTKEMYELTSYKGIKYFRDAFLFFGLAFFSRFILRFTAIINGSHFGRGFHQIGFFIFIYTGLVAGLLLIYSLIWKKFKHPEQYESIIHLIAILIAILSITSIFRVSFLLLLGFIFLLSALLAHHQKAKSKKDGLSKVHIIYILLFIALLANAAAHFFIRISTITSSILYSISITLFLVMSYKVAKSTARKK